MSDRIVLLADEGKFYTDGVSYGYKVILPPDADASKWWQVTEDELPQDDAEMATEEDYLTALAKLGVE